MLPIMMISMMLMGLNIRTISKASRLRIIVIQT